MNFARNGMIAPHDRIQYVCYGSNLCQARFYCYIEGGSVPGMQRAQKGARDPTPPLEAQSVRLPGSLYFWREGKLWGGSPAFYHEESETSEAGFQSGPVFARAYNISMEQFIDVVAQECKVDAAKLEETFFSEGMWGEFLRSRSFVVCDGWYGRLVYLGKINGIDAVTFTDPVPKSEIPAEKFGAPSEAYKSVIKKGLVECGHCPDPEAYLQQWVEKL